MLSLEPVASFVGVLERARQVSLAAYTLVPGPVLNTLVAAARRGAAVRVRLEPDPLERPGSEALHALNARAVATLRAAGADAALGSADAPNQHLKAALVDGVAWLDERNWAGGGSDLLRDSDPRDVRVVRSALAGRPAAAGPLAITKAGALRREAELIAAAGRAPLALESESFGSGGIYAQLLARARSGAPTRLLVAGREYAEPRNGRERSELAHLAALGVDVRIGARRHDANDKCALTAHAAWIGSANATYADGIAGQQSDWGLTTRKPVLVDGIRRGFEANWEAARPLTA